MSRNELLFGMSNCIKYKEVFWCLSNHFDGLWKMSLLDEKVDFVCELPEKNLAGKEAYSYIYPYGNYLYILPAYADHVAKVDIVTLQTSKIQLENKESNHNKDLNLFSGGAIYDKWLIVYSGASHAIYRIDLEADDVQVNDTWYKEIKGIKNPVGYVMHPDSHFVQDEYMYVPVAYDNSVLRICFENFKIDILKIGTDRDRFCCGIAIKNKIYMVSNDNLSIVCYDMIENKTQFLTEFPDRYKLEGYRRIIRLIYVAGKVLIMPCYGEMILAIDETDKIIEIKSFSNFILKNRSIIPNIEASHPFTIRHISKVNENFFITSGILNGLIIANICEEKYKLLRLYVPDKYRYLLSQEDDTNESYYYTIGDFLKKIWKQNTMNGESASNMAGKKIFESLK